MKITEKYFDPASGEKMWFYGKELQEYKAALHMHSPVSDGKIPHDETISLYKKAGYNVLAFTDHRKTNAVSGLDGLGMTLLSGIELHPMGPRNIRWHLLSLGVPEDFACCEPETAEEAIREVTAAGGVVFCAHPYWCGFTSAEVATLKGISGIEVYNTSTRYIGKDYNMQCWDELLDAGQCLTALAVDDMHRECDLFRGFTVILAEDRKPETLIKALKNGHFYASQGPRFHSITFENGILKADFTPVISAIAVLRKSVGICSNADKERIDNPQPETTHFEFDFSGYKDQYIRLQLRDSSGRMAWSNPIYLP